MSEPRSVEKNDMKKLAEEKSCSSSMKLDIRRRLFADIGNKHAVEEGNHGSDTGQFKDKDILEPKVGPSREMLDGDKEMLVEDKASEDNEENESKFHDVGHDDILDANKDNNVNDNNINEHIGTGIDFCTRDRIACRCAECMIRAMLKKANHGPVFNCAENCRICRDIQGDEYEMLFFNLCLYLRNFPMAALEEKNNDRPFNEYKEYQLDIILSFLSEILGTRTAAFKSQVIAVDLTPDGDSYDLVVYFRTDKYPEEFCDIWDDRSDNNPNEGVQFLRNFGTIVEYINERESIQHGPSDSGEADYDDDTSEYEPDELSEIADDLDEALNVSDGNDDDEEEDYSGVIDYGTEDEGIMRGGFEAKKEKTKKEEPKEDEMGIEFLGEQDPNEAGTSIGTGSTPKRQGTPMVSTFSSGRKRKSEPVFPPMVKEDDEEIEVIQAIKKPKTSM